MRLVPVSLLVSGVAFLVFMLGGVALHFERSARIKAEKKRKKLQTENRKIEQRIDSLEVINRALHDEQMLWLARALYSETRNSNEMYYIGWVVRNRVELNYNGNDSYEEIILDPYQFSAFNPGSRSRHQYVNLDVEDLRDPIKRDKWHNALRTAMTVIDADSEHRPFPRHTLYFYSEVSMPGGRDPHWRDDFTRVEMAGVTPERFRFFADFDYSGGTPESIPKTAAAR